MLWLRIVVFITVFIGTVLVYLPWALWQPWLGRWVFDLGWGHAGGHVLIVAGASLMAWCIVEFGRVGRGTPAPFDPPRRFVAVGAYRWVRNPMYVGALTTLAGEALLLGAPLLLVYAATVFLVFHTFVVFYEEPHLRATFGAEYEEFLRTVPRWIPRPPRSPHTPPPHVSP